MKKAIWIWENAAIHADEYAKFYDRFAYNGEGTVTLQISCDTNYECYVNGTLAAFGQYSDYPYDKVFDTVDITPFCKKGENTVCILVWYIGFDSSTYCKGVPALIYEIANGEEILTFSSESTLCKKAEDYVSGRCKVITGQLGISYTYDTNGDDGYRTSAEIPSGCHTAVAVNSLSETLRRRPNKKTKLDAFASAVLLDRKRRIYDLGRETVGYLSLSFRAEKGKTLTIGYGEYLDENGNVPQIIGRRNFSVELIGNGELCHFENYMRRLGCRYIQVSCDGAFEIEKIGLVPVYYPVEEKPMHFENALYQRIYDTCVRTLRLCMFEHYEDCPWREQALYVLDSRNQMLCGYEVFGEYEFPRSILELISKDRRADGFLSICSPSQNDLVIPFFSLFYPVIVDDYARNSGDTAFIHEVYGKMCEIEAAFLNRMKDGIVPSFADDARYWNFYEWSDTLCGKCCKPQGAMTELMLNAAFSISLQRMAKMAEIIGKDDDATRFSSIADGLNEKIKEIFFDAEVGLFRTNLGGDNGRMPGSTANFEPFSVLANTFAILCGAANHSNALKICDMITEDEIPYPATLSMLSFVYDAMLMTDTERYREYILSDIAKKWGYMLDHGATSFWETINGWKDFSNAGSLCHGWSAIPILYLKKLLPS